MAPPTRPPLLIPTRNAIPESGLRTKVKGDRERDGDDRADAGHRADKLADRNAEDDEQDVDGRNGVAEAGQYRRDVKHPAASRRGRHGKGRLSHSSRIAQMPTGRAAVDSRSHRRSPIASMTASTSAGATYRKPISDIR